MPTTKAILFAAAAAAAVTALSYTAGKYGVDAFEGRLEDQARAALDPETDGWVQISASGLELTLSGAAPDMGARTQALARISTARLRAEMIDQTQVATVDEREPVEVPEAQLEVEIVFGDGAATVFGSIPDESGAATPFDAIAKDLTVSPMLTPARGRVPDTWSDSVRLALAGLPLLERGQITITPGTVTLRGTAATADARAEALEKLAKATPDSVTLDAEILAPRDVIAPFAFRASHDAETGWEVAICNADTAEASERISTAIAEFGTQADCVTGLGAPSPDWAEAVLAGLDALSGLDGGALDITDADVALTGVVGQDPEAFEKAVETLKRSLPQVFSLGAILPPEPQLPTGADAIAPARFTALRTEDGAVRIRGDLGDAQLQQAAETFAEAQFGFDTVINETVARDELPTGWSGQVVAGLEALGHLNTGQLEVIEGAVTLTGTASTIRVRDELRDILDKGLQPGTRVALDVWEDEALAVSTGPTVPAELCEEQIALVLAGSRIDFPPSEAAISEASLPIIDGIAKILAQCPGTRFEIGGHTDSQGRESSNLALSQARADAVLAALLERQVDTVFLYARGYGEADPVATNETEEGRAQNRRIAFRVVSEEELKARREAEEETKARQADPETAQAETETAASTQDDAEAGVPVASRAAQSPLEELVPQPDPEPSMRPRPRSGNLED